MASKVLVRDVLGTLNGGQFRELAVMFADEAKPLYFHMTVQQAVEYEDAILREHTGLLMQMFLSELKPDAVRSDKRQKREENVGIQQVTRLTLGSVAPSTLKQYGMRHDKISKPFAKQFLRYVEHMTRPINLDRAGPKVSIKTAEEHKATVLRFAGYLVNVRGASADAISIEHVLEKDFVLQFELA